MPKQPITLKTIANDLRKLAAAYEVRAERADCSHCETLHKEHATTLRILADVAYPTEHPGNMRPRRTKPKHGGA